MGRRHPHVDAYIDKAADFARPILTRLRETVHAACPDVEETMKWSVPHFTYKGMLCSMAAFDQHAVFGFWKGVLVVGDASKADEEELGIRNLEFGMRGHACCANSKFQIPNS